MARWLGAGAAVVIAALVLLNGARLVDGAMGWWVGGRLSEAVGRTGDGNTLDLARVYDADWDRAVWVPPYVLGGDANDLLGFDYYGQDEVLSSDDTVSRLLFVKGTDVLADVEIHRLWLEGGPDRVQPGQRAVRGHLRLDGSDPRPSVKSDARPAGPARAMRSTGYGTSRYAPGRSTAPRFPTLRIRDDRHATSRDRLRQALRADNEELHALSRPGSRGRGRASAATTATVIGGVERDGDGHLRGALADRYGHLDRHVRARHHATTPGCDRRRTPGPAGMVPPRLGAAPRRSCAGRGAHLRAPDRVAPASWPYEVGKTRIEAPR